MHKNIFQNKISKAFAVVAVAGMILSGNGMPWMAADAYAAVDLAQIPEYTGTDNHVLYRVTPVFDGDNLVASGVQMEAESVEDDGAGVKFNVFCYNIQPGIGIDYATGDSWVDDGNAVVENTDTDSAEQTEFVINTNTGKFHKPDCKSVKKMKAKNKEEFNGSRDELIAEGYEPCGSCRP